MTEKEKLYTARLYVEKLANGINPIDGTEVPEDTVLNNVYLCRMFVYLADLLNQVIANNGCVGKVNSRRKEPFQITEDQRAQIEISEAPIGITVISRRITDVLEPTVKMLSGADITTWLEAEGLLETVVKDGQRQKIATEEGNTLGISTEDLVTRDQKPYAKNFYSPSAQAFIIANLEAIAEYVKK